MPTTDRTDRARLSWIRYADSHKIHCMVRRFQTEARRDVIHSNAQLFLWGELVAELRFRARRQLPGRRCVCDSCWPNFC